MLEVLLFRWCIAIFIFIPLIIGLVCGGRVKRVIGGIEVECGIHPRVASLRNATTLEHMCGTTLLSAQTAVTASHCVYADPSDYIVQLNNYCCDDEEQPPKAVVQKIYRHDLYDKYSRAHDIAILAISLSLDDVEWLEEDILPKKIFGLSGECMFAGYGVKNVDSTATSEKLLAANLKIISLDDCLKKLGPYMAPSPNSGQMCAVGINCTDSCQGDSGGPIMCSKDFVIEGISSYGQSCGAPGIPGVYTGVAAHLPWIKNILQDIHSSNDKK